MLALLLLASVTVTAGQRPFSVNDLFEVEDIGHYYGGPYAFSEDGRELAFTRVRAKKSLANHKWEYLWGNDGGDVWVQLSSSEAPVNITHGAADGSGWWSPQWSPDGEKLALLSTRGDNVSAWIWDAKTRELRQVSRRGNVVADVRERPYLWVDNQHLLYPALPVGERARGMQIELQAPTIATKEWPKVVKGEDATASVVESGVPVDPAKRPQDDLLLIDVANGNERVVAHGTTQSWQLAPNGKALAFTRVVSVYLPKANEKLPFDFIGRPWGRSTLDVVRLDGTRKPIPSAITPDVLVDSVRWSPDAKELAFLGYGAGRDQAPRLYLLNVTTWNLAVRELGMLDASPVAGESVGIEWGNSRSVLVYAKLVSDKPRDVTVRRDWWLVNENGVAKCLTANLYEPPRQLWAEHGGRAFVGLGDSKIWRIDPSSGKVTDLTIKYGLKIENIAWPSMTDGGADQYRIPGRSYSQLVFSARAAETATFHLLDLGTGEINSMASPQADARFVAYDSRTHAGIFYAADRLGLTVWRATVPNGSLQVLVVANAFLRDVAESEFKPIEYTSLNGETLRGWLMLPYDYRPGRRYPILTRVYPGTIYGEQPPSEMGIDNSSSLNLQIAAAHGYVVLLPSMPLSPVGVREDLMLNLPRSVLPAVDKTIQLGIADPEQLFLMGQSFGGYSTYGLVTQTQRFKAAVTLAGPSDLVSLYGSFDARERYAEHPQEKLLPAALLESAQTRMANPPWKDLEHYIRNSPIFFVDRVQTPLLIIQGDMDYIAIQQGEEFFSSLYRQGKRAEFVRYWGEGHVIDSPANIRDMWSRILAWLDDFGDISRDANGSLVFDGDHVKSRAGSPPLKPEAFARFD